MRNRRPLLLLITIVTLMLGLLRDGATTADTLRIHLVCPEHGEALHAQVGEESAEHELRASPPAEDHHGCIWSEFGPLPADLLAGLPSLPLPESAPLIATYTAPRGPPSAVAPLVNAPKTSPPQV